MKVESACERIEELGYCVLEDLLDPREAARLDARARRLMQRGKGYVNLEGALNPMPELAPLCVHPVVMEIAGHFLGAPFYLANNVCMKWCQPGAAAGHLHSDWPLLDVPRPYPPWPMLLQTMWMLTDFTAENGATLVVPGSHLEGRPPDSGGAAGEVAVTGRRGSLLVWHGTLWHRAAANTTTGQHRMGANAGYIPRFIHRPREEWPLLRPGLYESFPASLRQLLERSVE